MLLAHEPDLVLEVAKFPAELQLSGHSHEGQVRLPLIGAPVLPTVSSGLHRVGTLALY